MTQTGSNNGWQQAIYNNTRALGGLEAQVKDLRDDVKEIKSQGLNIESRISNVETDLSQIKGKLSEIESLLKWLKWIAGGVVTIALALIANFISSFIIN